MQDIPRHQTTKNGTKPDGCTGKVPGITIVEGGIDNDDIDTAREQASAVLELHPDLRGYLCCDASGPIGIATVSRTPGGRQGNGSRMDGIKPILDAIKEA